MSKQKKFTFKDNVEDMIATLPGGLCNPEHIDTLRDQMTIKQEDINMEKQMNESTEALENAEPREYVDLGEQPQNSGFEMLDPAGSLDFDWDI